MNNEKVLKTLQELRETCLIQTEACKSIVGGEKILKERADALGVALFCLRQQQELKKQLENKIEWCENWLFLCDEPITPEIKEEQIRITERLNNLKEVLGELKHEDEKVKL